MKLLYYFIILSNELDKVENRADTESMNARTLKSLARMRGLTQSNLARAIGVTRQTVSHWFSQDREVNLLASHMNNLAKHLGVSVETLSSPLPILGDSEERKRYEVELNWDRLYPDLESFLQAVKRGQSPALARLVQSYGLFQSELIAGKQVWKKFPRYRGKIHPAIRKSLDTVWNIASDHR